MQQLHVMNFLNEVASKFPDAISLASGRPQARFFDSQHWPAYQIMFTEYYAQQQGCDIATAEALLCQYGPSAGIINSILQQHLKVDEGIETTPSHIIVTNGCQEALVLMCLRQLREPNDCMLTLDPSYIGFSGFLEAIGKKVEPIDVLKVRHGSSGDGYQFDWSYLGEKVIEIKQAGRVPKAIYINPDFNNPLAYRLTRSERLSLIELCAELNVNIIEDNPYARFDYTGLSVPSLMALDNKGIVYHIGSFSKTFCPGVRMGYLVVPASAPTECEKLVALKSLVSVNSSSFTQSVIGGFLLQNNFSLTGRMAEVNTQYVCQRDALMTALDKHLADVDGISWEIPQGGFFAVVSLPFDLNEQDVYHCAGEHKVICMPVGFFSLNPQRWQGQVRLAFSHVDPQVLSEGVRRFSDYVIQRLETTRC